MEQHDFKSHILTFISKNPNNWIDLLTAEPYNLKIKSDGSFHIFNYNQILSDMSSPICQEARGFIINNTLDRVVCRSFNKFFNYGETHAAKIDWYSAVVQEKIDGSLIRYWYNRADRRWNVSTSGMIDAYKAPLSDGMTFGDLFDRALGAIGNPTLALEEEYTYVFELVSPENRIVVNYPTVRIYHIGTFLNRTGEEIKDDIIAHIDGKRVIIPKPAVYHIKSLIDCLDVSMKMGTNEEGFVVVDKDCNRIKIKSPAYLAAHKIKGNGSMTNERIIEIIKANAVDDIIGTFPEFTDKIRAVEDRLKETLDIILHETGISHFGLQREMKRAEFATYVNTLEGRFRQFLFHWYDKKYELSNCRNYCYEYIMSKPNSKIAELIGV